jgi:hypothetical protein
MKIEIIGTNTPMAVAALPVSNGGLATNAARRYASDKHYFPYLGFIGSDKCICIFGNVQSKFLYCDINVPALWFLLMSFKLTRIMN